VCGCSIVSAPFVALLLLLCQSSLDCAHVCLLLGSLFCSIDLFVCSVTNTADKIIVSLYLFIFLPVLGFELKFARQALYHLSYFFSPFFALIIFQIGS
jgi:ABC-type transport system involved in cytochrome c biogenesis permease component